MTPNSSSNLGCLIIAGLVLVVLILLAWIGFNGDPRNEPKEDIPVAPVAS